MSKIDPLIRGSLNIECTMHKDIEEDSKITSILPMRLSKPKAFIFIILALFSLGSLFLLSYWFPRLRILLNFSRCHIDECSHLLIKSKYYSTFLKPTKINSSRMGSLLTFHFQELPYYYTSGHFQPLAFNPNLPSKLLINTYNQGHLTSSEISDLRLLYGRCIIIVPITPLLSMIISESFNPFYVFQIYSIILWYFEDYYIYAAAIVFITLISLILSIVTTRQGMVALHNLAKKESRVLVKRRGVFEEVSSVDLVAGDLVEVKRGIELPCDMCLVEGGCVVEEGMLTGESVPVVKDAIGYLEEYVYDPDIDKRHSLYEGTRVIQTRCGIDEKVLGVVVRTGFCTVKGRLIRSIMYPKPNKFKFYEDSLKFIAFLAILATIGTLVSLPRMLYLDYGASNIIKRCLDLVTITVPPALPACMTVGVAFAVTRLKKDKIYCLASNRVNVAGRIDCIVFDKTGTLTGDSMNLLGVQGVINGCIKEIDSNASEVQIEFVQCMATCHSLALIDKELVGDPQDLQIFKSTGWKYEEPEVRNYDPIIKAVVSSKMAYFPAKAHNEIGILKVFHFTSKLQRMGVVTVNISEDNYEFYCKGAPEVILRKCTDVPEGIAEILTRYTRQGYRVLACAYKSLDFFEVPQLNQLQIEDFEENLKFLGLIILQNMLKPQTIPSLRTLKKAGIITIMATGDNVLTGISIARESGLISETAPVYLAELNNDALEWQVIGIEDTSKSLKSSTPPWASLKFTDPYIIAMTGSAFVKLQRAAEISDEGFKVMTICVEKCRIYARMTPENKTALIEWLQSRKYLVGMCGDGANDCGALKTADVGVSLSQADSSIAAPFTSQVSDISSVVILLREGRCALTTSIQNFKFMALYAMIQFTSVSLLYWYLENLTNNQFLTYDLLTVLPLAIFMSKTGPCSSLSSQMPIASLISLRILASITIQAFLQALFQFLAFYVAIHTFYEKPDVHSGDDPSFISYENTIIFYMSWFEYQVICAVFSIGKPWKRPSYSNLLLTGYQGFMLVLSVCSLFAHNDIFGYLFDVKDLNFQFKIYLIGLVGMYAFCAYFVESLFVPWVYKIHKKRSFAKIREKYAKELGFN